jgi:dynein heavy chain 1
VGGIAALKMSESEAVMAEVEAVSDSFRPFAESCSSIYFSLEKLAEVHFLYQFSLPFFMQIVDRLLFPSGGAAPIAPELASEKDPLKRLRLLTANLFSLSYVRVRRALLNNDQTAFALRLAQVALENHTLHGDAAALDPVAIEYFTKGSTFTLAAGNDKADASALAQAPAAAVPAELGLSRESRVLLGELSKLPPFARLLAHINTPANLEAWKQYVAGATQPTVVAAPVPTEDGSAPAPTNHEAGLLPPSGWELPAAASAPHHRALFHALLIAKALRSDIVPQLSAALVSAVFGDSFGAELAAGTDLQKVVVEEANAHTPMLLVSRPGFDASGKVDSLAVSLKAGSGYVSMAMGAPESYDQADAAIGQAVKKGTMLLLKNVHLSPAYLSTLEKRMHRLAATAHPAFR